MSIYTAVSSLTTLLGRTFLQSSQSQDTLQTEASAVSLANKSFPLLSLPLEIRLQILRYLCPNAQYNNVCNGTKDLRTDGFICSTAVFLINRQLYLEVRDEWYGYDYYRARIHPTGFHLHGIVSSMYREPSKTLAYIRCLDLEIQLRTPGFMDWKTDRKEPMGLYCCREFLERCTRSGNMLALRKLKLKFGVSIVCFEYYRDKMGDLKSDLEWEMKGLRQLRGLTEVHFTGIVQGYGYHCPLPEKILGSSGSSTLEAMSRIMEQFVQELAAEIQIPQ